MAQVRNPHAIHQESESDLDTTKRERHMRKVYVTTEGETPHLSPKVEWRYGTQFAAELLNDINLVAHRSAPFRIDTQDYKVYWAGSVLRVDIEKITVAHAN